VNSFEPCFLVSETSRRRSASRCLGAPIGRLGVLGALLSFAGACSSDAEQAPTAPAACVDDEAGGCLSSVRLTYLNVQADLEQPVFLNNRIPIEFGVTSTSPGETTTRNVAVGFTFVEAAPNDPDQPRECGSSAFDLQLVGDGKEQVFQGFIWPTSLCAQLIGKEVNLRVDFDGGEENESAASGLERRSVAFTEAARNDESNQQCRSVSDVKAAELGRGCVYAFDLQPTPSDASGALIDVRYTALEASSSVAVLPRPDATTPAPMLSVQTSLVVNGRDPYLSGVAPEDVPPELEEAAPGITDDLRFGLAPGDLGKLTAMPGRATLRYEIAPVGQDSGWLPLTVGTETGSVTEVVIDNLLPGMENALSHELFAEDDALAALADGGDWAALSDFTVRGCFTSDFAQAGNPGDDGDTDDCRTIEVVLVREAPNASGASSISFDREFNRKVGSSRINLGATLTTQNRLDSGGAFSRIEGVIEVKGDLGKSFGITVARAVGEASLTRSSEDTGYEITVDAFGNRVFEVSKRDQNLVHEKEFSAAKAFSFPGLGFGFGPVRVGFKFGVGGEATFNTADELSVSADPEVCQALLDTPDAPTLCGSLSRTVTPGFHFTASLEGGIDIGIAKAGVVADLSIVNTDFPLGASLAWGVGGDERMRAVGNVNWEMGMQLIRGEVALVGRVGIRRFSKSLRVNLFSFASPRFSQTLLERKMDGFEVLQ
jgi:hypothetical protein